jgi:hypothetical protein
MPGATRSLEQERERIRRENPQGLYKGRHYTEYVDEVRTLKKTDPAAAEALLLVAGGKWSTLAAGSGPAPSFPVGIDRDSHPRPPGRDAVTPAALVLGAVIPAAWPEALHPRSSYIPSARTLAPGECARGRAGTRGGGTNGRHADRSPCAEIALEFRPSR